MTEEYRQAISFTNSYFALVDGLASGLESYLAEDVVLDWFGRTVKGRESVTAFMEAHKVNSRHIFPDIAPTFSIGYRKKQRNRRKSSSYQSRINAEKDIDSDNALVADESKSIFHESKTPFALKPARDLNQNEIDEKETGVMDDMTYDINEGDLSNLFKLEITSTNIEEIENSINRIKLEEEMTPTVKAIKRECGQGDGPAVVETSSVKYVEANGEIEFSRKFWKRDTWDAYSSATSNVHVWKRPCKLQIAYSALVERRPPEAPRESKNSDSRFAHPNGKLPSLEEISEISGRLVPNANDFGGFLNSPDFFGDRENFLESFETEMAIREKDLRTPQYVNNKLVFNKPCANGVACYGHSKKGFVFNYQIHLIIYEGNNKCRVDLLREFEKSENIE